jgi:alcohol dehydrogenase
LRAIRHDGAKVYLDGKAEPPVAGVGEAVIRPARMGVTAFDARPAGDAPITLGQEFVGTVESLHADADRELRRQWEGKRVVGSPLIVCGRCDMCRAGLSAHCRARRVLGAGWDGCFADRFKLPLRNLVEVPRSVQDDAAVFAVPLSLAAHVVQLVRIEGKPYVTVLGDSVAALLCAQVMARLNASVRLLGSRTEKFALCERWGIKHRHVSEVGRRADQDIVVDATGTGEGIELALQLVRPRGKVVLTGEPRPDQPGLAMLVEREAELIGCRGGSLADAVGILARGEIDTLPLITKRARLAEGAAALRSALDVDQIKVLLEP